MRRGSMHTFDTLARANSVTNTRSEFSVNDIRYERKGGMFVTHKVLVAVVVVAIVIIVAAGICGSYVGALIRAKNVKESLYLSNEDEADVATAISTVAFFTADKYHVEVTPQPGGGIQGQAVIEFRYLGNSSIENFNLSAKGLNCTSFRLYRLKDLNASSSSSSNSSVRSKRDEQNSNVSLEDLTDLRWSNEGGDSLDNVEMLDEESSGDFEKRAKSERYTLDDREKAEINVESNLTDYRRGIVEIRANGSIDHGSYALEVSYESYKNNNALFEYNNQGTHLEIRMISSDDARFFPVIGDTTATKARFTIVVSRAKDSKTLSNMPLFSTTGAHEPYVWDTYQETAAIAPESVVIVSGKLSMGWEHSFRGKTPITIWSAGDKASTPASDYLTAKLTKIMGNYYNLTGAEYPYPKLDLLPSMALQQSSAYPGLIFMQESLLTINVKSPKIYEELLLDSLINALGQFWLEISESWKNVAVYRCFKSWTMQDLDDTYDADGAMISGVCAPTMEVDGHAGVKMIHKSSFRSEEEYKKGTCLLRMHLDDTLVNETIDEDRFRTLLANDSASVMNDSSYDNWTEKPGLPVVIVERDSNNSITLRQERFTYDMQPDDSEWQIPLTYTVQGGDWSDPKRIWLRSKSMTINETLGNDTWIVLNVNKTGYYRVYYNDSNWRLLIEAFEAGHDSVPGPTRAALIDDAFNLALAGYLNYTQAMQLISYAENNERDPNVWSVLFHRITDLNSVLFETPVYSDFRDFLVKFVSSLYNKTEDDGSRLSLIASQWACTYEHPDCVSRMKEAFTRLKNSTTPTSEPVIPNYLVQNLYCTVARYGGSEEFHFLLNKSRMANNSPMERQATLSSLGCFQVPWNIKSILYELLNNEALKEEDVSTVLRSFPDNPVATREAYAFLMENWQAITKRFENSPRVIESFLIAMRNGLVTDKDLQDFHEFRSTNHELLQALGGRTRNAIALTEAKLRARLHFAKNVMPSLEKLLMRREG